MFSVERVARTLCVCVCVVALAAVQTRGGSVGWGRYGAWKVRRTVSIPAADAKQPAMPGSDCCYVVFPTAGFLQADGRDLRVTVDGAAARFRVVDIGYGGSVRLVAAVGKKASHMRVYYGNPAAQEAASDWAPQRGLWLETRRYLGGPCTTLAGIRQAWAKAAGRRDGRSPVANVFHGSNPFGPQDTYLSRYSGWLVVAKAAPINFAVGADEIGYIVVGGKLAAAKAAWGPMNRRRRYAGAPIALSAGVHRIEVYHAERGGQQNIAAAWWMPGMKRGQKYKHYALIPSSAFAPLRYGRLVHYEVQGQEVGADFSYSNDGDELVDRKLTLFRFVFRDTSRPANRALKCRCRWDFGDGTTSTSRDPSHIYLRPGKYTATLTLRRKDQSWAVAQKIEAGPGWHRMGRRRWDRLANYYEILKEYQVDRLSTPDLVMLARIFEILEKPEEILASCAELYKRREALDQATLIHYCVLLGRRLRELKDRAQEAVGVFTYAEKHAKSVKAKARLANEKGDVYYYYLNDLTRALKEYKKTLTDYAAAGDSQVRLAQIRVGDIHRTRLARLPVDQHNAAKDDLGPARQAYERAAAMPTGADVSGLVATARRGSFAQSVEDYTRRGVFEEAHKALSNWEWEFPTDKLVGYSTFLRVKLAVAEDKPEEAIKQARELIGDARKGEGPDRIAGANRESEYTDDLLLVLADLDVKQGKVDRAYQAASRLLDECPESDLREEAHLKRIRINLHGRRAKYEDAAAQALDFAKTHEDSPNAPEALFLAARAQVRQKKAGEAVKTLERLTQKYPDSDAATRALQLLKELRRR